MEKIVMAIPADDDQKAAFRALTEGYDVIFMPAEHVTARDVQDAEIIFGNVSPQILRDAKKLKWLQLNSAGFDAYVKSGVLPAGVRLTSASGAYGVAVSEHMLSLTLLLMKKLHLYRDNMSAAVWREEGSVSSPSQSRVLVLGTGDIGSNYAKRMALLGAQVYGARRRIGEKLPYFEDTYTLDRVTELLPEMDVVAVTLPGAPELYHFFDSEKFFAMKCGAYFINAGRGSLVDQNALLTALNENRLAGAAIDVTESEPLPLESPLWQCRDLMITPHVAGGFHLPYTLQKIIDISKRNLQHYFAGEPLENQVL